MRCHPAGCRPAHAMCRGTLAFGLAVTLTTAAEATPLRPATYERTHRYLVAGATHPRMHYLVEESYDWRRDVDSFYTTNGTVSREVRRKTHPHYRTSEVWYEHPDGGPHCLTCANISTFNTPGCPHPNFCGWGGVHGFYWHESRYLATPSLANLTFWGDYDFLLYSDAETIWVVNNVDAMLQDINPGVPFFFIESMFPASQGACVFPGREPIVDPGCVRSPAFVPCTKQALLNDSTTCYSKKQEVQIWGGGDWGMIMSRGLMGNISAQEWDDCVNCRNNFNCYGGGDVRVGECVSFYGFAPTLPNRNYTIETENQLRLGASPQDWLQRYTAALEQASCDPSIDWTLPLSFHLSDANIVAQVERTYRKLQGICNL